MGRKDRRRDSGATVNGGSNGGAIDGNPGENLGPGSGGGDDNASAGNASGPVIDPGAVADGNGGGGDTGSGGGARKRGKYRPRAARSQRQVALASGPFLFMLHGACASIMKLQALAIAESEADLLAKAINDVAAFYDVPTLAPEIQAWGSLGIVMFQIYGSRIIAARAEARRNRPRTAQPSAENSQGTTAPPGAAATNGAGAHSRTEIFEGMEIEVNPLAAPPPPQQTN